MSHNTLAQYALRDNLANIADTHSAYDRNSSSAFILWLMMALVFIPMLAIHIGMRMTATETDTAQTEFVQLVQVQDSTAP